ncbi:hypothetical protein AOL_s00210g323 [Orbilia oligospora ATCC 24927]|uniref:F-box domain-containing protein n=1 Tax=Arthrobotrys oligospora (strain ATCC 24927 / CBS 115.81 / DSM 1491) TaxID=756982 RepID=G1XSG4_ARTOA|nr:hypothetical protein AOL_s00210g323 [Orbilia oligospora ATCC 24927]EGX43876.1 hypothetical protein AOL_s00210g323 [Orbilia oligospora ATCC 24927]
MKQDTGPNTTSKLAAQRLTETHEMDTLDSKCYFAKLPVELKTEILSYFPRWQLLKISTTCKDFRSICLRHCIKEVHIRTSNRGGCLKLLERYPDIRLAVRYLKIDIFKSGKDKWATPKLWDPIDYYGTDDEDSDDLTLEDGTVTKIRSEGTEITFEGRRVELKRPPKPFNHRKVLGAISKGFFDNVTRINIEYHAKDIKSFREFVNRLSKFQPTTLRILNIRSFELVTHEAVWMKPEDRGEIRFPKGLDYISYHPKSYIARFRALDLLKASFNTLTSLEIPAWHSLGHKNIPGLVCPTLRVLRLERHPLDSPVAETFSKFFPNVEELFLLEVQMPNALELEYASTVSFVLRPVLKR